MQPMDKFKNQANAFAKLTPDFILEAVEVHGFQTTGQFTQLNSYENRVYDIRLEASANQQDQPLERLIAKFYRPSRWSEKALQEEMDFLNELQQNEMTVAAPLTPIRLKDDIYYCLFPRITGRMPQELTLEDLEKCGRKLALLHNIGEQKTCKHRHAFSAEQTEHMLGLLENQMQPDIWQRYLSTANDLLDAYEDKYAPEDMIRIHGDAHRGNLLIRDQKGLPLDFFFIDFDDFGMGPVTQDFWMLLSGTIDEHQEEWDALKSGYEDLRTLPHNIEDDFELLRGLRLIRYSAWIAQRWSDPSFPPLFPQYGSEAYWWEELKNLEKIAQRYCRD